MTTLDLLTTRQVADELQVSVPTLNRWVRAGRLMPAAEADGVRGARFFAREDVEVLAAELKRAS